MKLANAVAGAFVFGLLTFGRSFAYLSVPPLSLAELFLGMSVLVNPGNWIGVLLRELRRADFLAMSVVASAMWGSVCLWRGVAIEDRGVLEGLRTFVFNVYPLFFYVGIGVARAGFLKTRDYVGSLRRMIWLYSCYVVAFFLVGDRELVLPWAPQVAIFNPPALPAVAPLFVLALWGTLGRMRLVHLALGIGAMLHWVGRGALLGLLCGFASWVVIEGRGAFKKALVLAVVLGGFVVGGGWVPVAERGGRSVGLDPSFAAGRIIATFAPEAAERFLTWRGYGADVESWWGTAEWRRRIWARVLETGIDGHVWLVGRGHGASLEGLVGLERTLYTPHNFAILALYLTGVIGLVLYGGVLVGLVQQIALTKEAQLRVLMAMLIGVVVAMAAVGNILETPFGAVPFYFAMGWMRGLDWRGSVTGRRG